MADNPTWEDVVSRVCLAGNPDGLAQAAARWHDAMTRTQTVQAEIEQAAQRVAGWTGSGGDEFRNYVRKLSTAVRTNIDSHQRMWVGLDNCARHLREAIGAIPVPDFMGPAIQQLRAANRGGTPPALESGVFLSIVDGMATQGRTGAELDNARQQARAWYEANQQKARQAYARLRAAYTQELANFPPGVTVKTPGTAAAGRKSGSAAKKAAPASKATNPAAGMPPAPAKPTTPTTPTPTAPRLPTTPLPTTGPVLPTTDPRLPVVDPATGNLSAPVPAVDPWKSPALSTGLAGVGTHLGGAGLGAMSGGAGGLPPLGPSVSAPDGMGGAVAGAVAGPASVVGPTAGQPATGGPGTGMLPVSPHAAKDGGQDWRNATLLDDGGFFDPTDAVSGVIT
jgi:hypothetical protein